MACTVAILAAQRCSVRKLVWLQPVNAMRRLFRPANKMAITMLTRLKVPVRFPTYSHSSNSGEANQILGEKVEKLTEENTMFSMMYMAVNILIVLPGT